MPVLLLVVSQGIAGGMGGVILSLAHKGTIRGINSFEELLDLVAIGFFAFVGQWALNWSAQRIPVGVASLVRTTTIIEGFIFQIAIFHETPTWVSLGGAAGIFIGVLLVIIEKMKKREGKSGGEKEKGVHVTTGAAGRSRR